MARNDAAARHLAEHLHEVPVLILCCLQYDGSPSDINRGASIYPAVQNMLLTARGLGLTSVLTTRPRRGFENRYGPTNRRAVEDVTFDEGWGHRWEAGT